MLRITLFITIICLPLYSGAQAATSLRGSRASLVEQNRVANKENLTRIQNERIISLYAKNGILVRIPSGKGLHIDPRLELSRRYTRPWTAKFLTDLGANFQKKFGKELQINSCVRDIETQEDLRKRNGNAAATTGTRASSHLTGATCDIARRGLSRKEQDYVRSRLLVQERLNHLEATEEHRQSVWHVMVYRAYTAPKPKPHSRK